MISFVVQDYWNESSAGYSDIVIEELDTSMREVWLALVEENRPKGEELQVLDAGCGPGFFSILMAQNGHICQGVDFSRDMLEKAQRNAEAYGVADRTKFNWMDLSALSFPDCTFDLILTRNVTWTLQNPTQVFSEWLRVLKPGGRVINFDANWNRQYYDEGLRLLMDRDFAKLESMGYKVSRDYEGKDRKEWDWIFTLPLNHEDRPAWDVKTMLSLGFTDIRVRTRLPRGIMNEYYSIYYEHIPVFMVCAEKPAE